MDKIYVAMTMYDRPEFLIETVDSINECKLLDRVEIYGFIDHNEDGSQSDICLSHFDRLRCKKYIINRPVRYGGSKNNAYAIKETFEASGSDWVIHLESDIKISPVFFVFMKQLYDEFSKNEKVFQINANTHLDGGRPEEIVANKWASSWGHALFKDRNKFFLDNIDEYLKNPELFAQKYREHTDLFKNGKFINTAWGGLLILNAYVNNLFCVSPKSHSRVAHLGWYGWHLNKKTQISKGIDCPEKANRYPKNFCTDHIENLDYSFVHKRLKW